MSGEGAVSKRDGLVRGGCGSSCRIGTGGETRTHLGIGGGARLDLFDPSLAGIVGDGDGNLVVEEGNVGVVGVGLAQSVPLTDEGAGCVREVGDVVFYVATGDVRFGRGGENAAEGGLPLRAGCGRGCGCEGALCGGGETVPVGLFSCDKQLLNYPLIVVVVLVLVVVLVIHFHQSRKLLDGSRSFLDMFLLIHYNNRAQSGVSFHKLFLCVFRVFGGT